MSAEFLLVLTTCPDAQTAERIAGRLVEDRLAACVNIQGGIRSVYTWRGAVESAEEYLLLIKTARERYPEVEAAIRARHPYELPEVIAVPIIAGSEAYLGWISSLVCVKQQPS
ncbi:MAG: divalent-cation tolerance protein CutA [Chromatiales bacterium]